MKIKSPNLSQFPSLQHAFFEADSHFQPLQKHISLEDYSLPLITLTQVHGNKVIPITSPCEEKTEGDGLVTSLKGIALGILTADCGPVLFYDPQAEVIGACHAGWRGAKAGVLQATLTAMEDLGAKRSQIHATLGPTIQQKNYEVGPEFPDLIGEPYETYFYPSPKKGHHYFNLPLYICSQLLKEGLSSLYDLACDTYTGNFYSRRQQVSKNDKIFFNNLSTIAIV